MRYDKGGALSVARSAEAFLGVEPGGGFLGDLGSFAFERYIRGRRSKILVWALYGIGLFMIVSYLVRMGMYFPDRPPYVYTRNNLLSKLIPFYEEMVKHLIAGRN